MALSAMNYLININHTDSQKYGLDFEMVVMNLKKSPTTKPCILEKRIKTEKKTNSNAANDICIERFKVPTLLMAMFIHVSY